MKHQHRSARTTEYGWSNCVTPDQCAAKPARGAAHGCIVRIDECACGAVRETEINGRAKNRGPWEKEVAQ